MPGWVTLVSSFFGTLRVPDGEPLRLFLRQAHLPELAVQRFLALVPPLRQRACGVARRMPASRCSSIRCRAALIRASSAFCASAPSLVRSFHDFSLTCEPSAAVPILSMAIVALLAASRCCAFQISLRPTSSSFLPASARAGTILLSMESAASRAFLPVSRNPATAVSANAANVGVGGLQLLADTGNPAERDSRTLGQVPQRADDNLGQGAEAVHQPTDGPQPAGRHRRQHPGEPEHHLAGGHERRSQCRPGGC